MLLLSVWVALLVTSSGNVCKSQPLSTIKKPAITYVAGPNQLTLLMDGGAFRFGYDTNNQFRAERRHPNGTVAGYYGYIGADGVPIRVKYGAVDQLGFTAAQEIIPDRFPEISTEVNEPGLEVTTVQPDAVEEPVSSTILPQRATLVASSVDLLQNSVSVDEENDSISVNAANLDVQSRRKFTYPKIELDPSTIEGRKSRSVFQRLFRSLPDAVPIEAPTGAMSQDEIETDKNIEGRADRLLVMEKVPGEPAIIYSDPSRRFFKTTIQAQFVIG